MENPNHRLIPGQFVRAEILDIQVKDAITVPKAALMQSAQGQFVYGGQPRTLSVEVRPVTGARELKNDWLISQGLNSGDRVITEGVIKASAGPSGPASSAGRG